MNTMAHFAFILKRTAYLQIKGEQRDYLYFSEKFLFSDRYLYIGIVESIE